MYAKRRYSFRGTISWSYKPFLIGFFYTLILCSLSHHFHVKIYLPWQPIGVVGIAVAFYLGLKTIAPTIELGKLENLGLNCK